MVVDSIDKSIIDRFRYIWIFLNLIIIPKTNNVLWFGCEG